MVDARSIMATRNVGVVVVRRIIIIVCIIQYAASWLLALPIYGRVMDASISLEACLLQKILTDDRVVDIFSAVAGERVHG
jgi:hypothetical protein